jgi:DNA-binding FrmR family transcriptional regulator
MAIEKMLKERRKCEDILNQISAVISGMEQMANLVFQTELQRMTAKKCLTIKDIDRLIKALNKTT